MSKKTKRTFTYDTSRPSSLVLVIGDFDTFDNDKFLKKYYGISDLNDEGETQNYLYASSFKTIKKIKGRFGLGFDYVTVKAKNVDQLLDELDAQSAGEVWIARGSKFECIASLTEDSREEALASLTSALGDKKIDSAGALFEVVVF